MQLFEDQDAKPVYQGKATARGIKCDVWKQTRVNWPGEYKSRMIWRWYFTQSPQQPVRSRLSVHRSVISQYQLGQGSSLGYASRMCRVEKCSFGQVPGVQVWKYCGNFVDCVRKNLQTSYAFPIFPVRSNFFASLESWCTGLATNQIFKDKIDLSFLNPFSAKVFSFQVAGTLTEKRMKIIWIYQLGW